jgi:hypothetical protein
LQNSGAFAGIGLEKQQNLNKLERALAPATRCKNLNKISGWILAVPYHDIEVQNLDINYNYIEDFDIEYNFDIEVCDFDIKGAKDS